MPVITNLNFPPKSAMTKYLPCTVHQTGLNWSCFLAGSHLQFAQIEVFNLSRFSHHALHLCKGVWLSGKLILFFRGDNDPIKVLNSALRGTPNPEKTQNHKLWNPGEGQHHHCPSTMGTRVSCNYVGLCSCFWPGDVILNSFLFSLFPLNHCTYTRLAFLIVTSRKFGGQNSLS